MYVMPSKVGWGLHCANVARVAPMIAAGYDDEILAGGGK